MPLTDLRNIPVIMNAKGWTKAADLLNNWFNRTAYTKSPKGVTTPEYANAYNFGNLNDWLLNQPEGKEAWGKIFDIKLWKTVDKDNGEALQKLRRILTAEGVLKPGISNVPFGDKNYTAKDYERTNTYVNASSFKTGLATTLTHCVAALGSFVLKIALSGKVTHTPGMIFKDSYTITPEYLNVYLWDSFDFEDNLLPQPLGCWNEADNSVAKIAPVGDKVCVYNSTFRDWRTKNKMGGDFYIYSNVYKYKLKEPADLETFELVGF